MVGAFALAGFLLDVPLLRSFGNRLRPAQPSAALGYIAIAVALYLPVRSKWVIATLPAVPMLVVVAFVLRSPWSGVAARGGLLDRPEIATLGILTMLTLAVALARRGRDGFSRSAAGLAGVALGVSSMSGIVVLFDVGPPGDAARILLPSLPATVQAIGISIALLAGNRWPGRVDRPAPAPATLRDGAMRRALPIVVLVPALNALVGILIDRTEPISPVVIEVVVAGVNIAIFAALVFWSMSRVAVAHAALLEATQAMDSAPILLTSPAGEIRHWSRGCQDLYGWSAAQAVGRRKYDLLEALDATSRQPLGDAPAPLDQARELIERRSDGAMVHVIERVRLVQAAGRPPVYVHALTDITARVATEAALQHVEAASIAQQEQFRLVLKTVPSATVIFDDREIIRAFSASAEHLFGFTAEEAIGRPVDILAASPAIDGANSFVDRYLKGNNRHVTDETPVTYARRRDGSAVPIELCMGDIVIGAKRLFVAFCKDLSEQLAAQERLGDMRAQVLHASRLSLMGEMAAGLAHEVNQPLAATVYFLGAADLVLADNANVEQGRALLQLASDQALRAGEIIRRMRGFAARESMDMAVGPIDGVINDAVALAFVGEAHFDIRLTYDLDPDATMVLCDRVQIGQVLVNLLRNAADELRKGPPVGRSITIATKLLDAETIRVGVADNGPGFDQQTLDQLYMPFVSTKPEPGIGVGLSICRRIVEEHGGTFDAANTPGGGAIFCFTLTHAA